MCYRVQGANHGALRYAGRIDSLSYAGYLLSIFLDAVAEKWQAVIIPLADFHTMWALRLYLQTIAKFEYQTAIAVGGDHIQRDGPNVRVKLCKCLVPFL